MGVPEEIRNIPRPKNTVVVRSGRGFRIREHIGCKNEKGRRIPIFGNYIGSIIDGVYVPDDPVPWTGGRVDIKYHGKVMLCWILNRDIFEALCQLYNRKESSMIYCMASIRACYPGTRNYQMGDRYDQSTLSNQFKDVDLSKNNVSQELKNLGMEYSRIRKFMRDRVAKMKENSTILVDGCLLQNHSRVDTLSQVSRKTRLRKHKDSLMIFAYDPDAKEPICSKLYPGNVVDSRAIGDFVRDNKIERGIIVADKGFTLSAVLDAIGDKKELHYLLPLKDDSNLITANGMYDFDSSFFYENTIECKKVKCDGYWLYSFRDMEIAKDEEEEYLREHDSEEDIKKLNELRKSFGTLVFQSDLDAPSSKMYSMYQERWLIELLFKFYQTGLDLDDTRVHSDYSDIGSEFIDFLAVLMASRMLNAFWNTPEMERWTFKSCMDFLDRLKKVRIDDSDKWENCRIPIKDSELFIKLGLIDIPIVPKETKCRGRPKGRKDTAPRKPRSDKGVKRKTPD